MSGWMVRVRALHAAGGGPLPRRAFDPMDTSLGESEKSAMTPAVAHGLVVSQKHKFVWFWTLTPKGRDWCEGRVQLVETPRKGSGRGKRRMVATWLQALPRAGEIRL